MPFYWFSAALRCGLIEAARARSDCPDQWRFPQHYAAASLKQEVDGHDLTLGQRFPQHYAAASLKLSDVHAQERWRGRFPQHYAAASLKLHRPTVARLLRAAFSAALRCGLIEAHAQAYFAASGLLVFRSITLRPH